MSGSLPDTVTVEDNRLTVKKVDNAVNTTFVCEVKNKHGTSSNQITTVVIGESVRPAGSHADTQTSTVNAFEWHHMQNHTRVTCWDLVWSVGWGGSVEGSLLIFTADSFSFFLSLPAIFWQELAELVWLTLSPRIRPTLRNCPLIVSQETVTLISNQRRTSVYESTIRGNSFLCFDHAVVPGNLDERVHVGVSQFNRIFLFVFFLFFNLNAMTNT